MLGKILMFPVMGPISGLVWIGEQIQERTHTEFDAQENLHKQLLSLQLSFDMGEMSEEEFEEKEEELLLRIQALEEELSVNETVEENEEFTAQPVELEVNEIYQEQLCWIPPSDQPDVHRCL